MGPVTCVSTTEEPTQVVSCVVLVCFPNLVGSVVQTSQTPCNQRKHQQIEKCKKKVHSGIKQKLTKNNSDSKETIT